MRSAIVSASPHVLGLHGLERLWVLDSIVCQEKRKLHAVDELRAVLARNLAFRSYVHVLLRGMFVSSLSPRFTLSCTTKHGR